LHDNIIRAMTLPTVRALREKGKSFDPRFFERDARFWPLVPAAQVFATAQDWPAPESYVDAFRGSPAPVQFVTAPPRRKRQGPVDVDAMYDAHIVRGEVPTRARNWHDFLNALVWATFPRAKLALHRRQHDLIRAWATPGALALPNARTRAQDALALVDEGGVLLLRAEGHERSVPFGHALFEGLVFGTRSMIARAVVLDVTLRALSDAAALACADEALAVRLAGPLVPEDLARATFAA
jgi:hypothetical protein